MQIQKIQNDYNNGVNRKTNVSSIKNIGFKAKKPQLIAISADSLKTESAKKLYSKIQRYFKLIGESGSIKDQKIMPEKVHVYISRSPFIIETDADVCLSIIKGDRNSTIKLYHKYADSNYKDATIMEATLDKNGQMFHGQFLPNNNLIFSRDHKNARRIYSVFSGDTFFPVGGNDRDWSCTDTLGNKKLQYSNLVDASEQGAFEIFLELARLKTSLV